MEAKSEEKIYGRLLKIRIGIELQDFPNPHYINQKISECHIFIDEVERYSIETTREISVIQQALNNAIADYEVKKENLLTQSESIKSLPSIKDREAKANSQLKAEIDQIHQYENTLSSLNNLSKAINLKLKNLNRINADIKTMVRVLESQIKLGMGAATDPVTRSLVEEMNKGKIDMDSFEDAESELIEEETVDPTTDLDIDDLLSSGEDSERQSDKRDDFKEPTIDESADSLIDQGLIDPIPDVEPKEDIFKELEMDSDSPIINEDWPIVESSDNNEIEPEEKTIDLDSILDFSKEKGGETEVESKQISEETENRQSKKEKEIGIDIDDLLNSIPTK